MKAVGLHSSRRKLIVLRGRTDRARSRSSNSCSFVHSLIEQRHLERSPPCPGRRASPFGGRGDNPWQDIRHSDTLVPDPALQQAHYVSHGRPRWRPPQERRRSLPQAPLSGLEPLSERRDYAGWETVIQENPFAIVRRAKLRSVFAKGQVGRQLKLIGI